jgi:hypothetical protein
LVQARWVSSAAPDRSRKQLANIPTLELNKGLGIAYVAALRAKVPVLLHDRSSAQIQKGLALMDKLLEKDVAKACLFRGVSSSLHSFFYVYDRARLRARRLRKLEIVLPLSRLKRG